MKLTQDYGKCSGPLPGGKDITVVQTREKTLFIQQPVAAGLKPFAGELSARWKRKKAQAKEAGFKSAWEMRKASHQAKHVGYTPTASAEPATPLLDRLEAGNGPVRIIVKDGVQL